MKHGDVGVYQPEDDGIEVLSIHQGKFFTLIVMYASYICTQVLRCFLHMRVIVSLAL